MDQETLRVIVAIVAAILTISIALFQLAVALGAPWGDMVMGGKYPKVLPKNLRILSGVAFPILLLAATVFLIKGDVVSSSVSVDVINGLTVFFTAYLGLNTLGNLVSKSRKEQMIMTPISLMIFLSGLVLIFA